MKGFKVLPCGSYPFLSPPEKMFIKQCKVTPYAASGPGGQKRNRKYSAVRITHCETGLSVIAEESRSQAENKQRAVKRLKKMLALNIRKDATSVIFKMPAKIKDLFQQNAPLQINPKNPLYPLFCATILDSFYLAEGRVNSVSKMLGITTGRVNKILNRDKDILAAANNLRLHFSLKPLK